MIEHGNRLAVDLPLQKNMNSSMGRMTSHLENGTYSIPWFETTNQLNMGIYGGILWYPLVIYIT